MRKSMRKVVENPYFTNSITVLIIVNAISIGLETYPNIYNPYAHWFRLIDVAILSVFAIEMILKIFVYRTNYFKDGWNLFDFTIVTLSLIFINTTFISVFRMVRVLRIFRTITAFPSLKRIVKALFMSVPAMGSTLVLIFILFYIYAIIGTFFFSAISPDHFGNLQLSFLTLFEVFTLDSWSSVIFRPIFEESPWSWIYFVSFIVLSAYIFVNLFFGELVSNAHKLSEETQLDNERTKVIQRELSVLKSQNKDLHTKLDNIMDMLSDEKKIGKNG